MNAAPIVANFLTNIIFDSVLEKFVDKYQFHPKLLAKYVDEIATVLPNNLIQPFVDELNSLLPGKI